MRHIENILKEIFAIIQNKNALSGFSLGASICFLFNFVRRIYGDITRRIVYIGPDNLNEIPWMRDSILAIIVGCIIGWIVYKIDKAEKVKGNNYTIPRIKFRNFGLAILFFSILFFGFIFIFVVREYNEKMAGISYMFRKTLWQYCSTNVPWPEIVATSLIFGIILAIGFSTTEKPKEQETIDSQ